MKIVPSVKVVLVVLCLCAFNSGCATQWSPLSPAAAFSRLNRSFWYIEELNGHTVCTEGEAPPVLEFYEIDPGRGRVTGFDGFYRFMGEYFWDEKGVRISLYSVDSSPRPANTAQGREIARMLKDASGFKQGGDGRIIVLNSRGMKIASLRPALRYGTPRIH